MKIFGVIDEDPFATATWSGSSRYFFGALRDADLLSGAIACEPDRLSALLGKLRNVQSRKSSWRFSYHIDPAMSELRSRIVMKTLRSMTPQYDVLLQVGAWYKLWNRVDRPVVSYHDGNLAARIASPLGVPKVSSRRLTRGLEFERSVYSGHAAIFTMSNWLAESFVKDFGMPREKVHAVYAGINMPEPLTKSPGTYQAPNIVFVGKDFPRKGGEVLLSAFAKVRRQIRDATLTLVGPQLENPPEGVVCAGFVSKATPEGIRKVSEMYRAASLFVLPSLYEPFGIAFCEAMAHGLPCIGTRICAMPEIIDEGQTGILVPPRDAEALAAAMLNLLTDERAREQMGAAGRARYESMFTWSKVASRIETTLRPLVSSAA